MIQLNRSMMDRYEIPARRPDALRCIFFGADALMLGAVYRMIDRANENGILCNVFWSDDEEETKRFLDMGIDTILTNDYHRIAEVVRQHKETAK